MSDLTTFKIGGAADRILRPTDKSELLEALQLPKPFVLGGGSNVLFADWGYRGTVVSTLAIDDFGARGNVLTAQCGLRLSRLARAALEVGLSGLEFAAGIPGTVGGAIFMNAGAYGSEMADVCRSVVYLKNGREYTARSAGECGFGYRRSMFSDNPGTMTVFEAEFKLKPDKKDAIRARMKEYAAMRSAKQPLEYPSAGSIFKRPPGKDVYAAALIEEAGLKGFSVGGAKVSEKHAGFIVNTGGATASDVKTLILHIQQTVREKYNIELEPEVKIL